MKIKILFYLGITSLLVACGSTRKMTMGITEPAIVSISDDVRSIGIINRSAPSKGNSALDKIDQILSAEGLNLDKKGAEAAIASFASEVGMLKNFDEIKIIEANEDIKSGLGVLPAILSWDIIAQICEENNVDLIFSLAYFDTDTKATLAVATMPLKNNLGVKVNVPAQKLSLNTLINCGWRIYDPQTKLVIDERFYTKNMAFMGQGINPVKALETIQNRNETIEQYSKNVGIAYAKRLVPNKVRISRDYFVSGTNNFKVAQRRALTGDWSGAAELWELELMSSNRKILGRANYNMAISSEIDGNLDLAIEYASKAFTDYKNRLALSYVNKLNYRVAQNNLLEQQASK
ncbi:DUF6340 family protein [Cellulophaga sp. Hel_I_12]|uniref:DUF6340 family protein n=1 Tax=Cellulophaga sp. Hel_I_12 TaxID=1249972 RepID=UPI00068DDB80|nr:DUF6340 family protein [Cellulophaga sp. Hel_I_12]